MKTDFLKELGIVEQSVIDAIMAENGKDVNAAKRNTDQLQTQVEDLTNQLNDRNQQLKDLKKTAGDTEELTNKIAQLEQENQTAATNYENKITAIQKQYAIENSVRDAKAKNVKAVMALLDMDKITYKDNELVGVTEQLENLKKGEDTGFLFGEAQPPTPSGVHPKNPPSEGGNPPTSLTLAEAISKHLNN